MATPAFLRSLLDLAACDSLDDLLAAAARVLERELGVRGTIELWDGDDAPIVIGEHCAAAPHSTWIGIRYTIGAIHLDAIPAEPADVELLARQLAPLAESGSASSRHRGAARSARTSTGSTSAAFAMH